MKINLPYVSYTIKVLVKSPEGEIVKIFDGTHKSFEIDLPDNVLEDEVEVVACQLDSGGRAIGNVFYLKEAIVPEPKEKDNEEVPVKADEDVSDEVADEEAPDFPEKEVEVRELPEPRELGDEIAIDQDAEVTASKPTKRTRKSRKSYDNRG
jgi:hypothetical protein